jgi:hypothetical protein
VFEPAIDDIGHDAHCHDGDRDDKAQIVKIGLVGLVDGLDLNNYGRIVISGDLAIGNCEGELVRTSSKGRVEL